MHRNIGLLIGAFLMVNVLGCSQGMKLDKYETKDPEIGVSLLYPSGWRPSEDRGSIEKYYKVMFVEPKGAAGQLRLSAISFTAMKRADMPENIMNPKDAANIRIAKLGKHKDFMLLSKGSLKICGTEAADAVYSYKTLDRPLPAAGNFIGVKERYVVFEKNDKFYSIKLFCQEDAYAGLDKVFDRMIKSVKFLPN